MCEVRTRSCACLNWSKTYLHSRKQPSKRRGQSLLPRNIVVGEKKSVVKVYQSVCSLMRTTNNIKTISRYRAKCLTSISTIPITLFGNSHYNLDRIMSRLEFTICQSKRLFIIFFDSLHWVNIIVTLQTCCQKPKALFGH